MRLIFSWLFRCTLSMICSLGGVYLLANTQSMTQLLTQAFGNLLLVKY